MEHKNQYHYIHHDFYDIPGFNNYIEEEEKKEDEKTKEKKKNKKFNDTTISNEDMKYISGIFKYIKNIIVREIFIVSAETYYKPQNLQIIKEIRNQLNVPIENNLLILTKIDKYPNKEELIERRKLLEQKEQEEEKKEDEKTKEKKKIKNLMIQQSQMKI